MICKQTVCSNITFQQVLLYIAFTQMTLNIAT